MLARVDPLTKGTISFMDEDIGTLRGDPLRQLRRKIQLIFQNPYGAFNPRMKIGAFLREPFINYHIISRKEMTEKTELLLESVGLSGDLASRYPHQLSGGELQRVAIARAMSLNPLLLICDEPTSALDVSIQRHITDLLQQIRLRSGVSMIFISHDLALIGNICEHVAVMYSGQIVESLPGAHLYRDARHPYTRLLLQSIIRLEEKLDEVIMIPGGESPNHIDLPQGCPFRPRCPVSVTQCKQNKPPMREISPGHCVACYAV